MRVVIISDFGDITGGAAKVAILSARGLAERGVSVLFICAIPPINPLLSHHNIETRCFDLQNIWDRPSRTEAAIQGIWNVEAARRLTGELQAIGSRDAIVHFHQWTKCFSPSAIAAAGASGCPVAITLHDYFTVCPNGAYYDFKRQVPCQVKPLSAACIGANCDARSYPHKVVRLIRQGAIRRSLRRASQPVNLIHVSSFAKWAVEPFLPKGANSFVVPNPVDADRRARVEVGRNRGFLYIGRFTPEKGCVQAAAAAHAAKVPITFLGDGPAEQAIRTTYPEARILPWGSAEAVAEALSSARALLFPSLWFETSGLVVAEALAHGVPAIVSRATAAVDLIEDGLSGLLVDPGDVGGLEDCLRRLQDDRLAERLSRGAYQAYWRAPPDRMRHAEMLTRVYREILQAQLALPERRCAVAAISRTQMPRRP
ncbi:glycosyltransferase [Rhodospirillaceae bacterium SYSU D60014]|uniref:glycosyltransferase n=1 Tax=Virgifigura deserti TaxID=2268457 RepID=UPI000E660450